MLSKREKKRKSNSEMFDFDTIVSTVKSNASNRQLFRSCVKHFAQRKFR